MAGAERIVNGVMVAFESESESETMKGSERALLMISVGGDGWRRG
jgi:hypothetical protein